MTSTLTDTRTIFVPPNDELLRMAWLAGVDARLCPKWKSPRLIWGSPEEKPAPPGVYVMEDGPKDNPYVGPPWAPHINDAQCRQVLLKIPVEFQGDYVVALYDALGYDDEAAAEKTWEFWAINAPPDIKMKAVSELALREGPSQG